MLTFFIIFYYLFYLEYYKLFNNIILTYIVSEK